MPRVVFTSNDANSLKEISKRARSFVEEIDSVVEMMESYGIKTIDLEMYDTMIKSMKGLEKFSYMARSAVFTHLENDGVYAADSTAAPKVNSRRIKKKDLPKDP